MSRCEFVAPKTKVNLILNLQFEIGYQPYIKIFLMTTTLPALGPPGFCSREPKVRTGTREENPSGSGRIKKPALSPPLSFPSPKTWTDLLHQEYHFEREKEIKSRNSRTLRWTKEHKSKKWFNAHLSKKEFCVLGTKFSFGL